MQKGKLDIAILADGNYPTAEYPLGLLLSADIVICCDASVLKLKGRTPDYIVGDMDTLPDEYKEKYKDIIHKSSCQETNDQTKAVRFLLERGKRRIAIVGATGKREDHTIGNISLLIEYARTGCDVCSFTDHGVFIPCNGTTTHKCRKGQQVSIFNMTARRLRAYGLLYPIYDFTNWWQGTLNECTGDSFTIEAEGEYLLFMNY